MSVYELRGSFEATTIESSMSVTTQNENRTQRKIEAAVKLIVLAVPGFLILMFCWLGLVVELCYGEPLVMNPLLGVPLAFVGSLMILSGTGQWGRWAYLLVFLSIPIVALVWALFSSFMLEAPSNPLQMYPKLLGMALFALPAIFSYVIVSQYYKRKADSLVQSHGGGERR